ncbi:MAG: imidazole glycerol phosphate synthase subunit HisH [Candidatus Omnitrophica bacterium]|nr:imidazole glycerol phosphate synthase subunit HisH [Candidatus Omnitrophota bacterium]MBU1995859.1 imidazole glycerol phosphate synthase subunit HisH [Candidatus Omnitrophota bacterium]
MKNDKTIIIDYGVGNHHSIENALKMLGCEFDVSCNKKDIRDGDSYILPGVGAFAEAMDNLNSKDILEVLNKEVLEKKKPILGICLGMQIMADSSEENGHHVGLGWIEGRVVKMDASEEVKIPHVGWNNLIVKKRKPLFDLTKEDAHYYFDHSYRFDCSHENISATCLHGNDIVAAVQKENIFGVQFHPEKSQVSGLKIFRSFFNNIKNMDVLDA